ncbi:MAG: ABC transporter ATP-binding protein [Actinobacteria bacterium]|nr:ABC transporter ATP-binding protein [Actinomycetota bacterium]
MEAVKIDNLTKSYGKNEVLKNISLSIPQGQFFCLMGPNGSGKTTLTSILASIRDKTAGSISIFGYPPAQARRFIGYMPQENFSSAALTGRENLEYFAKIMGYSRRQIKEITDNLLDKVGLEDAADKMVSKYSGGMRKRLELATVLFEGIKLLILDEPTTGLDPSARKSFFELVHNTKKTDTTIFLITHIGTDAELSDMMCLIDKGAIIARGSPQQLKKSSNLKNTITVETKYRDEKIIGILSGFNRASHVLDTEKGYKIFSDDVAEDIPKIIRELDNNGFEALRLESAIVTLEDVFYKLTGHTVMN